MQASRMTQKEKSKSKVSTRGSDKNQDVTFQKDTKVKFHLQAVQGLDSLTPRIVQAGDNSRIKRSFVMKKNHLETLVSASERTKLRKRCPSRPTPSSLGKKEVFLKHKNKSKRVESSKLYLTTNSYVLALIRGMVYV